MDFTVKRLAADADKVPAYELVTDRGTPLLQAAHTPAAGPDERRQLQLARPDGRVIATIDLPLSAATADEDSASEDYAIIHEFAVYAILGVRHRPDVDEQSTEETYFTLEVEGETWLALPDSESNACYAIYDEIAPGLQTYDTLTDLDLPAPIGRICRREEPALFEVALPPQRLQQTDLIVIALAFLIDLSV